MLKKQESSIIMRTSETGCAKRVQQSSSIRSAVSNNKHLNMSTQMLTEMPQEAQTVNRQQTVFSFYINILNTLYFN